MRLQVKYVALKKNGTIEVKFRTSWSDKNGVHTKHYHENDFDFYAIYCREKDIVLYVPNQKNCPKTLHFEKSANNQTKSVNWARNYTKLK